MATAQILEPYDVHRFNTIPLLHDVSTSFQAKNGTEFVEKVFKSLVLKHKLESQLGIGLLHRHFDLEGFEKLVEFNNISSPWAIKAENHMGGKVLPCSWLINSGKLMPYEFFFAPGASEAEEGQGGGSGSGGGDGGGSGSGSGCGSGSDPRPVIDKALDLTESKFRAFLDELLPAMESHKLNDTLALRLFPGPNYAGGHEITHGRTNITLTPTQASTDSQNFPFSSLRITQSKLLKRPRLTASSNQYKGVNKDNSIEAVWYFDPSYNGQKGSELSRKSTCHKYTQDGEEFHVQVTEE